ncbi:MAG: Spy/CpxP family protein refolding chaperone [Hydrogenophaga sp.]|nr:Spy/CpxP family protein refolding chaperone [Hydrogenophaga sp.]
MKLSSKRALIAAALATAFVGVSATAVAQGMGGMPHGMHQQHQGQPAAGATQGDKAQSYAQHHAQRMERMEKMRAEHQAQLKAALNLKPEQEPAWNAFLARTAPAARPAAAPAEDWSKLTTPQRLDKMQAMQAERQAEMAKRIDATKSFYAALTPEQQQVFDTQSHGGMQRTGSKGGHGAHHGMHHGAGMSGGKMGGMMGGMGCEAMAKPQG